MREPDIHRVAHTYAAHIHEEAKLTRAYAVQAAGYLRRQIDTHEHLFAGLSDSIHETNAEDELVRAEKELRHSADMIATVLREIRKGREPATLIAAE